MRIFGIEIKKRNKRLKREFEDSDRELSLAQRRLNGERRKIEREREILEAKKRLMETKAEYDELKNELFNNDEVEETEEENSIDNMFQMMLLKKLFGNENNLSSVSSPQTNGINTPNVQTESGKIVFTEQQLTEILNEIPKSIRKKLNKLDDATLKQTILSRFPNISNESLLKAIELLRNN